MYTHLSMFVIFVICDRIYKIGLIWLCLCHSAERNMSLTDMIFINTIKIFLSWIITRGKWVQAEGNEFLDKDTCRSHNFTGSLAFEKFVLEI